MRLATWQAWRTRHMLKHFEWNLHCNVVWPSCHPHCCFHLSAILAQHLHHIYMPVEATRLFRCYVDQLKGDAKTSARCHCVTSQKNNCTSARTTLCDYTYADASAYTRVRVYMMMCTQACVYIDVHANTYNMQTLRDHIHARHSLKLPLTLHMHPHLHLFQLYLCAPIWRI